MKVNAVIKSRLQDLRELVGRSVYMDNRLFSAAYGSSSVKTEDPFKGQQKEPDEVAFMPLRGDLGRVHESFKQSGFCDACNDRPGSSGHASSCLYVEQHRSSEPARRLDTQNSICCSIVKRSRATRHTRALGPVPSSRCWQVNLAIDRHKVSEPSKTENWHRFFIYGDALNISPVSRYQGMLESRSVDCYVCEMTSYLKLDTVMGLPLHEIIASPETSVGDWLAKLASKARTAYLLALALLKHHSTI